MNSRYQQMHNLLQDGKYFKLVCGAGNEDIEEVRKLATTYVLAGCNGLDVSATPEVVRACVAGIEMAYELAPSLGKSIPLKPFITVSLGMKGDHHVRKAFIDDTCIKCGFCISNCPSNAVDSDFHVKRIKCIGCGSCQSVCNNQSISFEHNAKELKEILPLCLEAGAENIELHAAVPDSDTIIEEWKTICDIQPNHFISMCLDRLHLSNAHLINRIRRAKELAGERLIIQADGVPMSGGGDDFNTTLQAISIADVIYKDLVLVDSEYKDLHILLSGGTNGKTGEMAALCNIPFAGIAIGTHARKIVRPYLNSGRLFSDQSKLKEAIKIAEDLINQSINYDRLTN